VGDAGERAASFNILALLDRALQVGLLFAPRALARHTYDSTRRNDMASNGTLHAAFIDELRDTYDSEKQLTKALPKMAKAASSPELRAAFETHLGETKTHLQRLEAVFEIIDEKARGKHCDGMAGILEEGKSIMEEDFDDATMDACLIAAGQRAEHYEMAAYGTLAAWANAMNHSEAADLLEMTLEEEKIADQKLTKIAKAGVNSRAARAAHPNGVNGQAGRVADRKKAKGAPKKAAGKPARAGRK
jgi:ferritin-like metal-binding protein YciE